MIHEPQEGNPVERVEPEPEPINPSSKDDLDAIQKIKATILELVDYVIVSIVKMYLIIHWPIKFLPLYEGINMHITSVKQIGVGSTSKGDSDFIQRTRRFANPATQLLVPRAPIKLPQELVEKAAWRENFGFVMNIIENNMYKGFKEVLRNCHSV